MRRLLSSVLTIAIIACCYAGQAAAQDTSAGSTANSHLFGGLQWRLVGPFRGGRALAVTGVPGEPEHFYFGAVDGGVWESKNAGRTWDPIFDGQPVASIGAIAVAPSAPKTIYVGSGEADMRSDIAAGNGMYKSVDGGKTWTHIGLDDSQQIGKIVVDPNDANVVYVAALGHQYAANAMRGVFKSTDGGATWSKVLYKDENTGAIDLALDPANANIVYASLWQTRRPPWNIYPPSNGPGSGIYKSTDAGKTWTQLSNGLPKTVGHVGLTISNAMPQRVYALVDTGADVKSGGVYRSDDSGATWTHLAGGEDQVRIWKRGWYFGGITADPKAADTLYIMDTATYRSTDGGKTFTAIKGAPGGDDYHTLWIDPSDSSRMILGSDQGVVVSVDGARTWSSWYNQPTAQFYHVITDNRVPYWIYGAQQDSGAAMLPSTSHFGSISDKDFHPIDVGGENGFLAPDPLHPGIVYGGSDVTTKERVDTGWEQVVDPTQPLQDRVWRHTWTLPLVVSQADKRSIYTSRQNIFRSTDGGNSWAMISPDLTRHDPSINQPANLDAPTIADNNGLSDRGVVYAIAPSPLDAKTIWAGTDDGLVWLTNDGGRNWKKLPAHLRPWCKVGIIDASHFDRGSAYVAVDCHRLDDRKPYIYKVTNNGNTWTPIANGIPEGYFVNAVREDPKAAHHLFAATERGMFASFDDGAQWQSLQLNLPVTSVRDIDVHGDDLVIATHGRGFWVLDDIARLRELPLASAGPYLFTPATVYRMRPGNEEGTPLPLDEAQAQNRTPGVYIDYIADGAPLNIDILNADGTALRTFSSTDATHTPDYAHMDIAAVWAPATQPPNATAGAHRFVWNFRRVGMGRPLVPPGTYTVRLRESGKTIDKRVTVLPMPGIATASLRSAYAFELQIEAERSKLADAQKRVDAAMKTATGAHKTALEAIAGTEPESNPDDSVGKPAQDFTSLRYLDDAYGNLEESVNSVDAAPTADQRLAFTRLNATLNATLQKLRDLVH